MHSNSMTILGKVFDRVTDMTKDHRDEYINSQDISFNGIEPLNIGNSIHHLRPVAQQSMANRLGIPIQYLRRCPQEVQKYNLDFWMQQERLHEKLLFRFDGADVRAIFTSRYVPADNIEILEKLEALGYGYDTKVQCHIDDTFFSLSIPDEGKTFTVNKDRMTPGISISNSEVGLASLSIAAFVLRLVCTNGLISKTEVSASYRHISLKVLREFPDVLNNVSRELEGQQHQLKLSMESPVHDPEGTIRSFNRQFELKQEEREAVEWAMPLEYGETMFHVVNVYTKAAQYEELKAEGRHHLQRVGGMILDMVK